MIIMNVIGSIVFRHTPFFFENFPSNAEFGLHYNIFSPIFQSLSSFWKSQTKACVVVCKVYKSHVSVHQLCTRVTMTTWSILNAKVPNLPGNDEERTKSPTFFHHWLFPTEALSWNAWVCAGGGCRWEDSDCCFLSLGCSVLPARLHPSIHCPLHPHPTLLGSTRHLTPLALLYHSLIPSFPLWSTLVFQSFPCTK